MNEVPTKTSENTNHYLTFALEQEKFALNVEKVIEILEVTKFTKVPKAPEYLKGVINLRGNVLPVIDTHLKFGMDPIQLTVNTCIIVMNIIIDDEELLIGALVDEVDEVLEINKEIIKPSPTIGSNYNPEFIEGVAKVNEEFVMILNIGKAFSVEEKLFINEASVGETNRE